LGSDGKAVVSDWVKIENQNKYCWIGEDGHWVRETRWICIDGYKYYLESGYRIQNNWRKDDVDWCYLGPDGRMVTNDFVKDSKGYCWIGEDGYMLVETKVLYLDNGTYGIRDGYMAINDKLEIDGVVYVFGEDGKLITVGM
jgi:glucan-binding YG repeat protein